MTLTAHDLDSTGEPVAKKALLRPPAPSAIRKDGLQLAWREAEVVLSNSTRDVDGHKVRVRGASLKPPLLL